MRFVDFLKTTVLLSAAGATLLAILTVLGAGRENDDSVVLYLAGWWIAATAIGAWIGRRRQTSPAIAKLLAEARAATMMPDIRPAAILLNRLWPLLVTIVVAGGLSFLFPQVAGIATGFAIIWSLTWRHQDAAVTAIEERDGVVFFVDQTSFLRPMKLQRLPGFRREIPS